MTDIISSGVDAIKAVGAALSYAWGNCTRWVAENLSWIPGGLGNAKDWLTNAQAKGLPTGKVPMVGAVAVWGSGSFGTSNPNPATSYAGPLGHVAIVTSVDQAAGTFIVSEENTLGQGLTDSRVIHSLTGLLGFIYPPGTQATQSGGSSSSNSSDLANINFPGGSINIPNPVQAFANLFSLDVASLFWRAALIIIGIILFVVGLEHSSLPGTNIKISLPNGGFARGQHDDSSDDSKEGGEEPAAEGAEGGEAAGGSEAAEAAAVAA